MSYQVLAIGDLHFKCEDGKKISGNKLQTDKLRIAAMAQIREIKPPLVVILGDVFDRFATVKTFPLRDATDFIYDIGALIAKWEGLLYVLVGNHECQAQTII